MNPHPREKRQQIDILADQADTLETERPEPSIERYVPFSTDILPQPIRKFVEEGAKAIGCDTAYLALPMLTVLASAISNARRIKLKRTWSEPAILWTAIVGDSGSMKSPALELALRFVREIQSKALTKYSELMAEFRDEMLGYERDMTSWKKKNTSAEPPETPEEPIAERYWCDDPTIEALAVLLMNQWRGLLMVRDELAGWLGNFDKYSSGKGSDVPRWLEMFGGRAMLIDRKTGENKMLLVPRAAVSITGGIQPAILRGTLRKQYRDNGLAARLLMVRPPRKAKLWTDDDIDPQLETAIAQLLGRLYELSPELDEDGNPQPVEIGLTPDAKKVWVAFYNEHAQEHAELTGDLAAAWSKLEGYGFSLVIHCVRWAAGDPTLKTPDVIDRKSVEAGIRLTRWFNNETRRIYAMLDENDESRERHQLIELIRLKGGSVKPRDLMRSSRQWATAADAEAALKDLVTAKHGSWIEQPTSSTGGRPTRVFRLFDTIDVDTTPSQHGENGSSVNVNGVNGPDDEWGEL